MTGKDTPHDHSYKRLFSHAEMVTQLLQTFVDEDWVTQLDFSSLQKVDSSFITKEFREREDDVIWRVKFQDKWLYLYILLEFQSSVDPLMAVRMMGYIALLYQDLANQKLLSKNNKLPPVLPMVLYNGDQRWKAATQVKDLLDQDIPHSLLRYNPDVHYLLLDEGAIVDNDQIPKSIQNLVVALFKLEHVKDLQEWHRVYSEFTGQLLSSDQHELKKDFASWLYKSFIRKERLGLNPRENPISDINDFYEVHTVLANRIDEWERQITDKAMQVGRSEGIEQGIEQGVVQGEQKLISRQLTKKFGSLPVWVNDKLLSASPEQLDIYGDRLLDAETLEQVFV